MTALLALVDGVDEIPVRIFHRDLGFLAEAGYELLVAKEFRPQHLNGDLPAVVHTISSIDDGHTACPHHVADDIPILEDGVLHVSGSPPVRRPPARR
jgi:hypothetical protein